MSNHDLADCFKQLNICADLYSDDLKEAAIHKLFLECLQAHDYEYIYSEDHAQWLRGLSEERIIVEACKTFPYLKETWECYKKAKNTGEAK